MCDNPQSTLSLPQKLARLQEYTARWRAIDWTMCTALSVPASPGHNFNSTQKVFMVGLSDTSCRRLLHIPSGTRGVSARERSLESEVWLRSFWEAMSSCDDVLLLNELLPVGNSWEPRYPTRLHINQLSTGKPHPKAPLACSMV
jgi:hypothetical protein